MREGNLSQVPCFRGLIEFFSARRLITKENMWNSFVLVSFLSYVVLLVVFFHLVLLLVKFFQLSGLAGPVFSTKCSCWSSFFG